MSITATYIDANTFKVATDRTADFMAGRRVRADCGADGFRYGTISGSSYSDPDTTVVLYSTGDDLTSNLESVLYGVIGTGSTQSIPIHSHDGSEGSGGTISGTGGSISDHGSVPTTNGDYTGRTYTLTCDDTPVVGSPLYIKSNGHLGLASATSSGTMPCKFLSVSDSSGSINCVRDGYICNTDWSWTPGEYVYVTTSSGLSHDNPTASGNWIQPVGIAISTTAIVVDIQPELLSDGE